MPPKTLGLRPEWGIAGGMALCSFAAITRTQLSGQLAVSDKPAWFWPYVAGVFAVGMSLAALCYLLALRSPGEVLGRSQLAAAIGIHLCAALATPLTSNDVFFNLAHGRLVHVGLNPYEHVAAELPAGDPFAKVDWPQWRYPYGPLALVASWLSASLQSVGWGVLAFKLAMLAAILTAIVLAFRLAQSLPASDAISAFAFIGFNPLLAWEMSGQSHNDALPILATIASLLALRTGRPVRAAMLMAAAVSAKLSALPLLALYLLALARTSLRASLRAGIASAAVIIACWAPFLSAESPLGAASALATPSESVTWNSFASFARLADRLTDQDGSFFRAWALTTRLVVLAGLVLVAVRCRGIEQAIDGALRVTTLVITLGLSYVNPWYVTWLLPLALLAPERRLGVALYATLAPVLYLTGIPGAFAILLVQGVGLALVCAPRRVEIILHKLLL